MAQILKKMKPMRQIEAAQLMVTMNKYTINYARLVLSRLRSGLSTHLCSLSFKGQGTFAPER
jgi:hypothetical protein